MEGLYAIIDPEQCGARDPLWVAERILAGGCAALQLRAKSLCDRDALILARALRERCRDTGVPFWMNDRPHLALLAGADGLHLGQDDLPLHEARRIVGAMPIGVSTHNLGQVERASQEGAALLGFGPIFGTRSKTRPDPEVGIAGLAQALHHTRLPVVPIGGITLEQVPALRAAGAHACAVIRALCAAEDPSLAARDFTRAFR